MSIAVAPARPTHHSSSTDMIRRLCEAGSARRFIADDSMLAAAVALFADYPEMRLLPVVDQQMRPVGAIVEADIRSILFNPFGHALMRNPAFGRSIDRYRRGCPIADSATPIADLLDIYARASGSEGMIVTDKGRLCGVLANATLVRLAARHEADRVRARVERLGEMEQMSEMFRQEAADLSGTLRDVATAIQAAAAQMAERSAANGARAAGVAVASQQIGNGVAALAARGRDLFTAIDKVGTETLAAKAVARDAVALVENGNRRADALDDATSAIEARLAAIQAIARQANTLAINAAIEAARAGGVGGTFTVIAREIRQFAAETVAAAEGITTRVTEIRSAVDDTLAGHRAIERIVVTIEGLSHSVDTAIGAQLSTMRLLAENADQAAQAESDIRESVAEIGTASHAAAESSAKMRSMADHLTVQAGLLGQRVDHFVNAMRGA